MTVILSNADIPTLAEIIGGLSKEFAPLADLLNQTKLADGVVLDKKILAGSASIEIKVSSHQGGARLDVSTAKVFGLSGFGLIRKLTNNILLAKLSLFPKIVSVEKIEGDLLVKLNRVQIDDVVIAGGILTLQGKIN